MINYKTRTYNWKNLKDINTKSQHICININKHTDNINPVIINSKTKTKKGTLISIFNLAISSYPLQFEAPAPEAAIKPSEKPTISTIKSTTKKISSHDVSMGMIGFVPIDFRARVVVCVEISR